MSTLGALGFLAPWWLAVLAALPVLWWLLRVTPPAPRRLSFPAIRLLLQLTPKEETPAKTPWWLLLLRLVIAMLVILALAHPLLNPGARLAGTGPIVLVVDDGWAAARHWPKRKQVLGDLLDRAEREDRPVVLLATAASIAGDQPRASRLMRAAEARAPAQAIEPKSWPVDRAAATAALDGVNIPAGTATVIYLADGLDEAPLAPFLERLQRLGPVELLTDAAADLPRMIMPPSGEGAGLTVSTARADIVGPAQAWLRAVSEDGRMLAREELRWNEGQKNVESRIVLPVELRNRVFKLELEGEATAGAVVLLDERWRRRPVGLVSGGPIETLQPLLADVYYLERALNPYSEVRLGTVEALLQRELAVLLLADVGRVPDNARQQIDAWIRKGGVLVRFAGPRLAEGADDLVPVTLRAGGGRSFGGAMSWAQPMSLAPFDGESAFAGLAIPQDVKVSHQVLAEPSLDLSSKTWARLTDGTPIVTAEKRGDGWVILIHTTANPEWSSLPLSGLFVEMLRRVVGLSQGIGGEHPDATLAPLSSLDGFGRLQSPPPAALAITGRGFAEVKLGPRHPPGFYGTEAARRALNLSAVVPAPQAIANLPPGIARGAYAAERAVDFKPWLLAAALLLALVDLVVSLMLRGVWPLRRAPRAAAMMLAALLLAAPAAAQVSRPPQPAPASDDGAALTATLTTHIGYIITGNPDVDEITRAGLTGLGYVMTRRTAVDPGAPIGLDVETDELGFFPLIYWPIIAEAPRPSPQALARVGAYLRQGGNILFDTREADTAAPGTLGPAAARLRDILRALNLPPLVRVPATHVLTKAFYLIQEFPGRWAGAPVWVEQPDERVNDGVSSVVIGGHDWAGAWAIDAQNRPLLAVVPGGEEQREYAFRFGVNLVMYALTGNYKADQVHVEAILERLKR